LIAAEPDPVPTVEDSNPTPIEDATAVQDNLSTEEVDKW
jgi:hypothetical protein